MTRALIVDDDSQVLSLAERWLLAEGFDVVTSNDFKEARAEIQLCKPDVVVLDVRLGEFNGLQLGLLAQDLKPEVRLVLISGWDDPVLRRESEQLGGAYLQKPFTAADLISAIRGEP